MLTSFLIGLLAGGFGGLVGLGGDVFIIALTVRYFKFTQIQAHATALMGLTFTGLAGAFTYYLHGSVDFTAAVCLASAAIITARFGALYAHALPEWQLKRAFGVFLLCVSALLLAKPYIAHLAVLSHPAATWVKIAALVGSGAAAGFLGGMMGVGGGSIMIPAMVLVVGLSQYTAQGTSLLAIAPIGMMGAFTHWRLGNMVVRVLLGLVVGVILGSFLSGSLAHFLSQGELRLVFVGVLTWMGVRNIRAALRLRAAPASHPSHA